MKILLCFICLFLNICAYSQEPTYTKYKYPMYPGDSIWQQYTTNKERMSVLQIKENQLVSIPTQELLDVLLKFPLWNEVLISGNLRNDFDDLAKKQNTFKELKCRTDFISALIEKEKALLRAVREIDTHRLTEKGDFAFICFITDMIASNDDVVRLMNNEQRSLLSSTIYEKDTVMKQYPDVFGGICQLPMMELKGKLNLQQKQRNALLSSPSYYSVNVYTPNGTFVPGVKRMTGYNVSYSASDSIQLRNYIYSAYNGAIMLRVPSWKYDAPGYTWHTSETGEEVIFNYATILADTLYWSDGSYIEAPEEYGSKVVYDSRGDFSAVKVDANWYISKWGHRGPLVRHHPRNIPDGLESSLGFTLYTYPNSDLRFYMPCPTLSICGDILVSSNGTYSIPDLPSWCSVVWSVSDSYYNSHLQQNYPNANQCTITNSPSHEMVNGTLTATLYYNGHAVLTKSKTINSYITFKGYYIKSGSSSEYPINLPDFLYTSKGGSIEVHSLNLIGATANYEGSVEPTSWNLDSTNGILTVNFPPSGGAIIYQISLGGIFYYLTMISSDSTGVFSVVQNNQTLDISLMPESSAVFMRKTISDENTSWLLEVYSVSSGRSLFSKKISGNSCSVDKSSLPPGIYLLNATVGKNKYAEKIVIE